MNHVNALTGERMPLAVGTIPVAVEGHLHGVRNINERLHDLLNRLRVAPPTPVQGESGGCSPARPALATMAEYVSKEISEMSDLLAEIERFV